MTDRIKTALVTGGAKRIGRAIVEDLAANGFAVAIHCNRSADEGDCTRRRDPRMPAARATVVEADLTDMSAADGPDRARRRPNSGRSACWSTTPRSSRTIPPIDLDPAVLDRHFDIHVKAPVLLARHAGRSAAGRERRG